MERDDRAPVATFFAAARLAAGEVVNLPESAAHHARVKRLAAGDPVRLTDGAGRLADGSIVSIGKSALDVAVERVRVVPAPREIHLRVPIADRDRMLWLAEKATELGVASWQAIRFQRSSSVSPRGEGAAFADKVRARVLSALEQSGGAWLPRLLPDASLADLIAGSSSCPIVLDAGGEPLAAVAGARPTEPPTILVGPEGGLDAAEMSALTSAGWRRARLAPTTLRFETAGIAAVASLRATYAEEE